MYDCWALRPAPPVDEINAYIGNTIAGRFAPAPRLMRSMPTSAIRLRGASPPRPRLGEPKPVPPSPLRQRRQSPMRCKPIMPPLCENTRLHPPASICPEACAPSASPHNRIESGFPGAAPRAGGAGGRV